MSMDTVGSRIAYRRGKLGIKQTELLRALRIQGVQTTQQNFSKIEKGRTKKGAPVKVPEDIVLGCSKVLQCNPGWLATGDGPEELDAAVEADLMMVLDHGRKLSDEYRALLKKLALQLPVEPQELP